MGFARLSPQTIGAETSPFARQELDAGDGDLSFWQLWLRHQPLITQTIASCRVPANADGVDFRQAVLERVERKSRSAFSAFQGKCSIAWYFRRIVDSAIVEEVRARKRANVGRCPLPGHSFASCEPAVEAADFDHRCDEPSRHLERTDRAEKLIRALQDLAADSDHALRVAKAVVWRCVELRSRREIADALHISERQVDRYILAGLGRLRSILAENYGVLDERGL